MAQRVTDLLEKESKLWNRGAASTRRMGMYSADRERGGKAKTMSFASSNFASSQTNATGMSEDTVVHCTNSANDTGDLLSYAWDGGDWQTQEPGQGIVSTSGLKRTEKRHPLDSLLMKCKAPGLDSLMM